MPITKGIKKLACDHCTRVTYAEKDDDYLGWYEIKATSLQDCKPYEPHETLICPMCYKRHQASIFHPNSDQETI